VIGKAGTDDLSIAPVVLLEIKPGKPGILRNGGFRIREQKLILLCELIRCSKLNGNGLVANCICRKRSDLDRRRNIPLMLRAKRQRRREETR
jgi:hypothetical protein